MKHHSAREGAPNPGTHLVGMTGGENGDGDTRQQVQEEVQKQQTDITATQIKVMFQTLMAFWSQ